MRPSRRLVRAGAALVLALGTSVAEERAARADGEVWLWTENRVPLVRHERPDFPRVDWRISTDTRLNARNDGLHQAFLRSGPLVFVAPFAFVALQGTIYADRQAATGAFAQEARLELEPNVFFRAGDFTFNDRNRGEVRFRETGTRTRYRNQLRMNYAPVGARWIPFVWDEVLFDLTGPGHRGFQQNRFEVGLGRMLDARTRLDVGYMFRSREEPTGWVHDHVLNLWIFFDAPRT